MTMVSAALAPGASLLSLHRATLLLLLIMAISLCMSTLEISFCAQVPLFKREPIIFASF